MGKTKHLLTVLVAGCFQTAGGIKVNQPSQTDGNDLQRGSIQGTCPGERLTLQVDPARKFAFCKVPKVASVQFADMAQRLNGLAGLRFNADMFAAAPERLGVDRCSISKENGWTFAAFIMDPLQRHLSEFFSKCVQHNGKYEQNGEHCAGPVVQEPSTVEDQIVAFEQQAQHLASDPSFLPASTAFDAMAQTYMLELCTGSSPHSDIDFIGVLSESQACNNAQVKEMLRKAGYNATLAEAVADATFPSGDGRVHAYHSRQLYPTFYRNRSTGEALHEVFAEDVRLFHDAVAQPEKQCVQY
jgi:hypothetical protein